MSSTIVIILAVTVVEDDRMARVAVQMLEDQIAMGVDVNDVSLRDAKAMMVKTKETLDEVRMLKAWSAGRRDAGM